MLRTGSNLEKMTANLVRFSARALTGAVLTSGRFTVVPLALVLLVILAIPVLAQEAIVIRAGTLIDGKGVCSATRPSSLSE